MPFASALSLCRVEYDLQCSSGAHNPRSAGFRLPRDLRNFKPASAFYIIILPLG